MTTPWADHAGLNVSAQTAAEMTALHVYGITRTLGPERAAELLAWLGWPEGWFKRTQELTDHKPMIDFFLHNFERTLK